MTLPEARTAAGTQALRAIVETAAHPRRAGLDKRSPIVDDPEEASNRGSGYQAGWPRRWPRWR